MLTYVVQKLKLVFFVSPKCGSQTVRLTLTDLTIVREGRDAVFSVPFEKLSELENYTRVFVYRDPLSRLVSSFFMPEVGPDVTFQEFITNIKNYESLHQKPQFDGGNVANKLLELGAHHAIETSDLNNLSKFLKDVIGDSRPFDRRGRNPHHIHERKIRDNESDPCHLKPKKEFGTENHPPSHLFYEDKEMKLLCYETTSNDNKCIEEIKNRLININ